MSGRLAAESEPGGGSTFYFTATFGLGKANPPLVQEVETRK